MPSLPKPSPRPAAEDEGLNMVIRSVDAAPGAEGCESFTWVTFIRRGGGVATKSRPRLCRR